ncbi:hypothetical protein Dimus_005823 [Dionaea muscipula]
MEAFRDRDREGVNKEGGWIAVVRKHSQGMRSTYRGAAGKIITLFVEDLPDNMDHVAMYKLFAKYAVEVAIQKTNGLWISDKELKVKMAELHRNKKKRMIVYGKKMVLPAARGNEILPTNGDLPKNTTRWVPKLSERSSYANVVKYDSVSKTEIPTIKGVSYGNGWLHRSAVASLRDHRSSEDMIDSYMEGGRDNTIVRRMGNKQLLLTYQTEALMNQCIEKHNKEGSQWFTSLKSWSVNLGCTFGREVWLSFYGIPIHAWNTKTFCDIGNY